MLRVPDLGRSITKMQNRGALAAEWADDARLKKESKEAFKMLSDSRTVKALDAVFARLSKPKL